MTSIASPASSITASASANTLSPIMARVLLVLVTTASVAAGLLVTGAEASTSAIALAGGSDLLRAMALLKVAVAAGMAVAVLWRFGSPVTLAWWAAYALACAGMVAGPGLIWQMAYVRTGALLQRAGLFAVLILLWRDPVTGARLSRMVAARRAMLRSA